MTRTVQGAKRALDAVAFAGRRVLERAQRPVGVILAYHRIADTADDPFRICVSPERFQLQLAALSADYRVVALDRFLDTLGDSPVERPMVAVTFDDGYADTLEVAYPIAAASGVPITVFATVEPVLSGQAFWWDRLSSAILGAAGDRLTVDVSGRTHVFVWSTIDDRYRACRELHQLLRRLRNSERREALEQLATQGNGKPEGRPLTLAELRELAALPGVTVGAHSVGHPALAALPRAEQIAEISGSRRQLSDLLGREVDLFAYPYGRGADLSAETTRIAARAGYRAACTTIQGAATRTSRPHLLPRLTVYESTPTDLVRRLQKLLRHP